MTTKRIAIIGECMIELQSRGDDQLVRSFGGDTLNTAVYLSRMNKELDVSYVTALGQDNFSQRMLDAWQSEGVQTDYVLRLGNKEPGLYLIETDETGERTFQYWRNDAAARFWFQQPETAELSEKLAEFDYLYLSGISLAIIPAEDLDKLFDLLAKCRANGGKVIFDNNYRPRLWSDIETARNAYKRMLEHTDIALLTFDDEIMLYGEHSEQECLERSHGAGVQEIIIKRGAEPCLLSAEGKQSEVSANRIDNVVDTTAAGDSFSAGYLAERLKGESMETSAKSGHLLAGTVIQHRGAVIPASAMPKTAE